MPPIDLVKTERGCGTGNGIRKRKPETEFGNGNRKRKRKRTSVHALPGCAHVHSVYGLIEQKHPGPVATPQNSCAQALRSKGRCLNQLESPS